MPKTVYQTEPARYTVERYERLVIPTPTWDNPNAIGYEFRHVETLMGTDNRVYAEQKAEGYRSRAPHDRFDVVDWAEA